MMSLDSIGIVHQVKGTKQDCMVDMIVIFIDNYEAHIILSSVV